MARLYDCENKETYIEFEFIYHIPGELEGSRFYLRYFKSSVLTREVSVGWTNRVINMFLNLLSNFPNQEFEGYFSHYEKHLELKWIHEAATNQYLLIWMDLGTIFTLKSNPSDLKQFAYDLKYCLNTAPKI